jgi:hypothetical protein
MLTRHILQDIFMNRATVSNRHSAQQIGDQNYASVGRSATRTSSVLFKAGGPSMYWPTMSRCMIRLRGGRLCGAPAMVNGRCRQHGGKTVPDQHYNRPHIERIIRIGHFGTNGCALNDAVVAYRTQQRLKRLVDIASRRSELDPDQGAPEPTKPT